MGISYTDQRTLSTFQVKGYKGNVIVYVFTDKESNVEFHYEIPNTKQDDFESLVRTHLRKGPLSSNEVKEIITLLQK